MSTHALRTKRGHVELAIQRFDGGGEPMLLIHGIDAEMLYWHDGFCGALADAGFQVARFDNRDSGESTRLGDLGTPNVRNVRRDPDLAPYRLEDMADDAVAVLDELGWPTAHVVGHSLGGSIALLVAIRHADRVRTLTTISSTVSGHVGRIKPVTILRLVRATPAAFLGRDARGPEDAADRLIRGHRVLGSPDYPADEAWLREIARVRHTRGNDPAARARHAAAGWATGDLRPALASVRKPTLVLHGECDPIVRPEGGRAIAGAVPNATLVMIPGMGHDLPPDVWPILVDNIKATAASI